jgi:pimeloyl-ACP methyl ester carboxylesterase
VFAYPFSVAGVRTRILQGGSSGPVVILLHGLSARADRWGRNLDSLAAHGLRVLAIDLPGHGFADKGGNFDYTARGYTRWLEQFIDMLGEEKVVMVGTSFGGLVAANFALHHPSRLHGLVAVGAVGLVPMREERRRRTIAWLPQMSREEIRGRLQNGLFIRSLITDDLVEEDHRINTSEGAAQAFASLADYYRTTIDDDAAATRLATLSPAPPIKFIWGEHDASVSPEYGIKAQQAIPGSTLSFIPGTGHFPYMERPEEFNRVLLEFIDGLHLQQIKQR